MEVMSHESIILLAAVILEKPERATRFWSPDLDGTFIIFVSNTARGYYSGKIPLKYLKYFDKVKLRANLPLSFQNVASKPESILYPERKTK